MDVEFNFAARSDIGLLRGNNQDSGYAGPHLLVLADGMGGAAGGDIASSVAVAHLVPLDTDAIPADQILLRLRLALQEAHDELVERTEVEPKLRGMGTTCIAVLRSGNKLGMVHIGDSRAYVLRQGELSQVTTDHSFVQYLVATGQITPEEADTHPQRSVILRVLGDAPGPIAADESMREAVLGDRWLLCSDGLSGVVSHDTIQEVMATVADPGECADKLIELALNGGGPDNVTCVVADVVSATDSVATTPQVVGAAATDRLAPTRGGQGAAGKAAALVGRSPVEDDDEAEDTPAQRSWWRRGLQWGIGVVVVALIAGLGVTGWSWTQNQYYAVGDGTEVVIYQGIPQQVGPLSLSHPVEKTGIMLADLTPADRLRLAEPVTEKSLEQIREYLELLRQNSHSNSMLRSGPAEGAQSGQSGG